MMSHEGDDEDGLDNDRMVLFGQCSADWRADVEVIMSAPVAIGSAGALTAQTYNNVKN